MNRNIQLPHGKRLNVYKSGDPAFKAKPVHFNPRIFKSFDSFLDEVSEKVPTRGAVRSIHTPNTGTLITSLEQLDNRSYVAAGYKGFTSIPGGYENIGKPIVPKQTKTKVIRRPGPRNDTITIHLHKNGNIASKPRQIILSRSDTSSWTQLLQRLNVEPDLSYEPISRLYTPNGRIVTSEKLLENNGVYVAATPNESFRHLPYSKSTVTSPKQTFPLVAGEESSKQFGSYRQDSYHSIKYYGSQAASSGNNSSRRRKSTSRSKSSRRKEPVVISPVQKSQKADAISRDIDSGYTEERKTERSEETDSLDRLNDDNREGNMQNPDEKIHPPQTPDESPSEAQSQSNEAHPEEESHEEVFEEHRDSEEGEDEEQRYLAEQQHYHDQEEGEDKETEEERTEEEEDEEQHQEEEGDEEEIEEDEEEGVEDEEQNYEESAEEYAEEGNESSTDDEVSSFFAKVEQQKEHLLQAIQEESEEEYSDSGHASLLSNMGYNSPYYASDKSRPTTQAMMVDYDEDKSGFFRARSRNRYTENAEAILDSSATKIELPIDMIDNNEVEEVC